MTAWKTLFTIRVTHTYYAEKISPDLRLHPLQPAELARHRLVFKRERGGGTVACPVHADGTPRVPLDGLRVLFALELRNPHMHNFTALPRLGRRQVLFHRWEGEETELPAEVAQHTRSVIHFAELASPEARSPGCNIEVVDRSGQVRLCAKWPNEWESAGAKVDLSALPDGLYGCRWAGGGESPVYKGVLPATTFALVHLDFSRAVPTAQEPALRFEIPYEARSEQWTYYVFPRQDEPVSIGSIEADEYQMAHEPTALADPLGPETTEKLHFSSAEMEASPVGGLALRFESIFADRTPRSVPFAEKPPTGIRLQKGSDELVAHMPCPSPRQGRAEVYVYL